MHDAKNADSSMFTAADATVPDHAEQDHPKIPTAKIGILLANLGTPDGYDYWSMRRYLGEFLSDKRVIDYSPLVWQPLLQGVILTMYDRRNNLSQQVEMDARSNLGELVFKTMIPRNVRVSEAPSFAMPVLTYDPQSKGAEAYRALASELISNNS